MAPDEFHYIICDTARRVTDADKNTLARLGVRDRSLADQGEIGIARVKWHRDRGHRPLFDFAEDGEPAFIQRVASWGNATFDLVAWSPTKPDRWALLTGLGTVLGEPNIERAAFHGTPIHVWRRPVDFLANDFEGTVLLDPTCGWAKLSGLRLIAEDVAHGDQISRDWLPGHLRIPEIVVERRAA
jgi:hypothetical protein